MAFAGYGRTAVGAPRSHSRPTHRRLAPLWLLWHLGIGQALRAGCLVSGLRPVICMCPAHPWPRRCAALALRWVPVRPQGAPSAQRPILQGARRKKQQALRACVAPTQRSRTHSSGQYAAVLDRLGETATERQPESDLEPQRRKDLEHFYSKSLIHMVGVKGFEPSTPCTPCKFWQIQENSIKA